MNALTAEIPASAPADSVAKAGELERTGRLAEAQAMIGRILARTPDDAEAVHFSGVLAFGAGRSQEALELMERSVRLGPPKAYFLRNLCEAYRVFGRYDEALAAGEAAVKDNALDPISHVNLAVLHYGRGEPELSIAAAERALALDGNLPGAHFALAEAYLLKGDFARGWEEYEWRFRLKGVPRLMPMADPPQWDGSPLPGGRLMLIADQGFGDCIQFSRYIPWAASQCGELVIACSREMAPVVRQLAGGAMLFDRWEDCPPCLAHCPLSGLPRLHRAELSAIPAEIPYLRADPDESAAWKARLDSLIAGPGQRIGVVWAGRPTHRNDANRSMALRALAPLAALDGVTLVSLQKGEAQAQVGDYFGRAPLINLGPQIASFADTMAIVEGLDLVVTVDTSVGHLAGAMGKPVFIMLPAACDWRWLQERSDSPWYPSVRLFRQAAARDWSPVVAAVADAVAARLPAREHTPS